MIRPPPFSELFRAVFRVCSGYLEREKRYGSMLFRVFRVFRHSAPARAGLACSRARLFFTRTRTYSPRAYTGKIPGTPGTPNTGKAFRVPGIWYTTRNPEQARAAA